MANETRTILTSYGNDQILKAMAEETNVYVAAMVYGDGGGSWYPPQKSQTSLVNQIGSIKEVTKKFDDKDGFIYFSATIPSNVPEFVMREIGLIDTYGKLLAVSCIPDVSKPAAEEGIEVTLPVSIGFKTSTGEVMLVYVDGGETMATKIWVAEVLENIKTISSTNFY